MRSRAPQFRVRLLRSAGPRRSMKTARPPGREAQRDFSQIYFSSMKIQNTKEILQATHANLSQSEFNDVNLQEAIFTNVNLSRARFTDINFSGAKFSNLNLTNVEIEACETTGMKFRGVLVSDLFEAYRRKA